MSLIRTERYGTSLHTWTDVPRGVVSRHDFSGFTHKPYKRTFRNHAHIDLDHSWCLMLQRLKTEDHTSGGHIVIQKDLDGCDVQAFDGVGSMHPSRL